MSAEAKVELGTLTVSASPHIRSEESIPKIMWSVNAALAPAALFSVYNFGMPAAVNLILCIAVCVFTEWFILKWQEKPMVINDGSAFMTGLLLAMNIPATLPWYMPVFGSIVAVGIAKHTMGGLGYNIFNPALVGRAFLLASWPIAMTTWPTPQSMTAKLDAVTAATPLGVLKLQGYEKMVAVFGDKTDMYKSMLLGLRGGSLGETSALLLLLGGIFLIIRGYIHWQMPVCMIGTVGILTAIAGQDPVFHMMSGGLILGAFYMATDMVTTPTTIKGQIIFAMGAGALTVLIRLKGGYPEGVCYAILLMNCLTPLIDRFVRPVKYGTRG